MEQVLIAFDNDNQTEAHSFFEDCADDIKQHCIDCGHQYTPISPPYLVENRVIPLMKSHSICMLAAHGYADGIHNQECVDVVSTRTANYNFSNKIFYAVSCRCAINLCPELKRIGLKLFVGYDDTLYIQESNELFRESALSGLKSLLNGDSIDEAKKKMYNMYTRCINNAPDKITKRFLLHNREHLCFR